MPAMTRIGKAFKHPVPSTLVAAGTADFGINYASNAAYDKRHSVGKKQPNAWTTPATGGSAYPTTKHHQFT